MFSYKDSGVNIDKANYLNSLIQQAMPDSNMEFFSGIFEHPYIPDYFFSSSTDGIGTKILPLIDRKEFKTIAIDLAAMNLNDLICSGAKPLFFMDYLAVNKLNPQEISILIKELKSVLEQYHCILIGGETAELGNLIQKDYFDIAGFVVGLVKKENLLSKNNVKKRDIIVGLSSSGIHANGFSLIRKLHDKAILSNDEFEKALTASYIYVDEVLELCDKRLLKACANITGGGIEGNLSRIIPSDLTANIFKKNIPQQPLFKKILSVIDEDEAYKVFNMGVGICLIINPNNEKEVMQICSKFNPFIFGEIVENEKGCSIWLR